MKGSHQLLEQLSAEYDDRFTYSIGMGVQLDCICTSLPWMTSQRLLNAFLIASDPVRVAQLGRPKTLFSDIHWASWPFSSIRSLQVCSVWVVFLVSFL